MLHVSAALGHFRACSRGEAIIIAESLRIHRVSLAELFSHKLQVFDDVVTEIITHDMFCKTFVQS